MTAFRRLLFLSLPMLLLPLCAGADLRVAGIFQDDMVLQRDMPVPVWGWAEAGSTVEVMFAGQTVRRVTGEDGSWRVDLQPLDASSEGRVFTVRAGGEELRFTNVVVGEVWIAAGQSNMNHAGPDEPTGLYPHYTSPGDSTAEVRRLSAGLGASLEPLEDLETYPGKTPTWEILGPDDFTHTNMANYFARVVRDALDVPVGILHVAVSGTPQNAWMARATLESFPGTGDFPTLYHQLFAKSAGENGEKFAAFKRKEQAWRESGRGKWPGSLSILKTPTVLYNTRIHTLAPAAVRGVIWHQGEGGASGERMVAKVRQWRELFGREFHFIWGTLTRETGSVPTLTARPEWFYRSRTNASLRRALDAFGPEDRFTMVELYDVGDHDTHFHQKAEAGRRMALAALDTVYGRDTLYTGPRVRRLDLQGGVVVAEFDLVGEGLRFEPSVGGISGFYIQGTNTDILWAEVEVTGPDRLRIFHPDVDEVVAVGYAVAANPHETLFNSAGLPASPFRRGFDRIPWSGHNDAPGILKLDVEEGVKYALNLSHVRRGGYVFQVKPFRRTPKEAAAEVSAFVPDEWNGYTVRARGRSVRTETVETEHGTFATFEVPIDGSWVVVADPGVVDDISKVRRY